MRSASIDESERRHARAGRHQVRNVIEHEPFDERVE